MRFESRRGQNEQKKKKLQFEKTYSLYNSFLAGPLTLQVQYDF
jgi:hypothetical protein